MSVYQVRSNSIIPPGRKGTQMNYVTLIFRKGA
uniref:Uncharacterized protein n=1 Tax=Siphoviridae sp. ctQU013 TaxID=2826329 RepID=A0A8S5NMZ3_9CAUD|nr:MAG TPA: hypothetical protein [Siphoviridae sp. ctQU013]